jgi:hypothetical protein
MNTDEHGRQDSTASCARGPRFALLPELDTSQLPFYAKSVEVELTPGQKAFIRQAIETGRLHREEEACPYGRSTSAVAWKLLAAVDKAEASLARGEGRTIMTYDGVTQLVADVKRRGIARLS